MQTPQDDRDHGLVSAARAASPKPEPITYNGRDIETMSRDELLAVMREIAPAIGEMQGVADEFNETLRALMGRGSAA